MRSVVGTSGHSMRLLKKTVDKLQREKGTAYNIAIFKILPALLNTFLFLVFRV